MLRIDSFYVIAKARSLLYSDSLAEGKKDLKFKKKQTLALELIDKSLKRGYRLVSWLNRNRDLFIAYKASLGFVRGSIFV